MTTNGFEGRNLTKTRLQEKTEKRKAEEDIQQIEELKRQKKLFELTKLIGPRDILVNSDLPTIKLEKDAKISSSMKQEPLEVLSNSSEVLNTSFVESNGFVLKQEVDSDSVVKMEEMLEESSQTEPSKEYYQTPENIEDLRNGSDHKQTIINSEIDKGDSVSGAVLKHNDFFQTHIENLQMFIERKEQEIKSLLDIIKGMQLQLHASVNVLSDLDVENEQFVLIDSNINKAEIFQGSISDNARIVASLTSTLMEKHAKARILSMKMLKLQDKMFGTAGHNLEISNNYKTSGDFVQDSFKLVLPFLYPELQLNDILRCRLVCRSWQSATDSFLSDHPSLMSFDKETHFGEQGKLKYGRLPILDESPLKQLAKVYRFSSMEELKTFYNDKQVTSCLKRFSVHIKSLVILQSIDFPDFRFGLLINYVKICLGRLPNVEHFKVVFSIDKDKLGSKKCLEELQAMGKKFSNQRLPGTFPELQKLESLEFVVEVTEEWRENTSFLQYFCKRLVQPYSKQLKKLCICTPGIDPSDILEFPNLVEISMPINQLYKLEFVCQHVEKCTITGNPPVVNSKTLSTLKEMFPKLSCLGFTHEDVGEQFHHRLLIPTSAPINFDQSFLQLTGVKTLELENCGAITFCILDCFPNLQYLKLINKYTADPKKDPKHPSLEITKLCKGSSLYEAKEFLEHFHNVSWVTLEFSGETLANIKPRLRKWTREGFTKYCRENCLEEILQM